MIRRWSAASGLLLLLLFLLAVYQEITPEWKRYQQRVQRLEEEKLLAQYEHAAEALNDPQVPQQRAKLEARLRELQEALARPERQRQYREAERSLRQREERLQRAQDRYQQLRADQQMLEQSLRTAEESRLPQLRQNMEALLGEIEQAAILRDDLRQQNELQRARVQEFTAELNRISEQLAALTSDKDRLAREAARARRRSPEIQQVLLEELHIADRCATCHLGAARDLFPDQPVPYGKHPGFYLQDHPVERFGCAPCHGGQPRATTKLAAHGRVQHWPQPLIPKEYLGEACGKCHREADVAFEPWLNDGRRLSAETGCVGCHDINGHLVWEKTGPDLSRIGDKVYPPWLERWLKNPKDYLPATRMPNFLLSDAEVRSIQEFLLSLRAPTPAEKFAPSLQPDVMEAGKRLYNEARCVSCHAVNGRGGTLGPDLGRVAGKARPAWLLSYLREPRSYWARTRMPRFRFSEPELQALVAYITSEFQDGDWPVPEESQRATVMQQEAAQGKELVRKYGCYGCHDIPGFENATKVGAELNSFADKEVSQLDFGMIRGLPRAWYDWTRTKLKNPRAFREGLIMPSYDFTDQEAAALAVFLRSLSEEDIPFGYRRPLPPGSSYEPEGAFGRLVAELNCLVCHTIRGRGGTLAPDLSYEGSRVRAEWLRSFLKNPATIRLYLVERMPQFHLRNQEVEIIVNYARTVLVHNSIPERVFAAGEITGRLVERGRQLYYQKYACQACHQIGLAGGALGPELTHISQRLTEGWLVAWLKGSQKLVPGVREPQYNLSEQDARAVAAFLLSLPAAEN